MQKSILSKKRKSIEMTTSLDHQPLCCQNTFYKQFILVYKLITNNYKISRNTQALGLNPLHHPSPLEKGWQTAPIFALFVWASKCFGQVSLLSKKTPRTLIWSQLVGYLCNKICRFQFFNLPLGCRVFKPIYYYF